MDIVKKQERKFNLDALRILSMLFIVSLHYLGVGGGYYNITDGNLQLITPNYCIASLLEAFCVVGVNCFVLISGYFLLNSRFKARKILQLYLTTIFYSFGAFLLYSFQYGFGLSNFIRSFFPLLMSTYWFITVYVILYLLSPFLNKFIEVLTKKQHLLLIVILVSVFSVWKSVLPFAETIDTRKGYSLTWFIVLYLIGAYIAKYGVYLFKKNLWNAVSYFIIAFLSTGMKLLSIVASTKIPFLAEGQNLYYHYDSVTVLAGSIFLFVFFSRIQIKSRGMQKAIQLISPSVFSVYLIHENFLWREHIWNNLLHANSYIASPYFILHYSISVIVVFVSCIALDQIRQGIFWAVTRIQKRKEKDINDA